MKRIENLLIFAAFTAVLLGNGKEPGRIVAAEDGAAMAGRTLATTSQDGRREQIEQVFVSKAAGAVPRP